jgi:dGTP triphosphohydrolase
MRSRHIADYIAGMTDRFAERAHRGIYGNKMDRRVH